jgi:hypothetical protein
MSWFTKLASTAVQRQNARLLKQVEELTGEKQMLSLELHVVKEGALEANAVTAKAAGQLIDSIKDVLVDKIVELETDLGHARDENRRLGIQLANALNAPWPTALTGARAVLTPAQRADAADDAAWKRAQDGCGDV